MGRTLESFLAEGDRRGKAKGDEGRKIASALKDCTEAFSYQSCISPKHCFGESLQINA